MEDKDVFKFRVTPLTTDNYNAWSNDSAEILKGKGLWRFVEELYGDQVETPDTTGNGEEIATATTGN